MLHQYDQLDPGLFGTEQLPSKTFVFLRDIPDHLPEVMLPVDHYFWMAYDLIVAHIKLLADMADAVPVEVANDLGDSLGVLSGVNDQLKGRPSSSGRSVKSIKALESAPGSSVV